MDVKEVISTVIVAILILIIYYAVYFQKQKQQKEIKKMQDSLKKGDKIVTYSGLSGTIEEMANDRVIISAYPDNTKLSLEKWSIAGIDDRTIDKKDSK